MCPASGQKLSAESVRVYGRAAQIVICVPFFLLLSQILLVGFALPSTSHLPFKLVCYEGCIAHLKVKS